MLFQCVFLLSSPPRPPEAHKCWQVDSDKHPLQGLGCRTITTSKSPQVRSVYIRVHSGLHLRARVHNYNYIQEADEETFCEPGVVFRQQWICVSSSRSSSSRSSSSSSSSRSSSSSSSSDAAESQKWNDAAAAFSVGV